MLAYYLNLLISCFVNGVGSGDMLATSNKFYLVQLFMTTGQYIAFFLPCKSLDY